MIRTLLPSPLLSLSLLATWLLLNGVGVGQWLLGGLLAVVIPRLLHERGAGVRWNATIAAVRLGATVLIDIVVSATGLARLILGPESRVRPGFVRVPLTLRDERGVVLLASIITLTPGTLTVDIGAKRDHLLVHAFDLADADATIDAIRQRYEAPLRMIFGEVTA